MTHDATTLARRAFLAAAILLGLPPPVLADNDAKVMLVQRRRDQLLVLLARTTNEDEVPHLCDMRDDLAAEISRLPTASLAAARVKLMIVAEDYVEAHTADGFDLRLLHQVIGWMRQVEGAERPGHAGA